MTSRDFCYWLQGFFELGCKSGKVTDGQVETIKRHLAMVFIHEIDPSFGGEEKQKKLNSAHTGGDETPAENSPGGQCPSHLYDGTLIRC